MADSRAVVVIELVTGERVVMEDMTAEQVISQLYNAGRDRFAAFKLPTGAEYINPAHVVRVSDS